MTTWIALLRGINVGGKHKLPMKTLVDILEAQGCADVKTYIQSGNAVFNAGTRSARGLEGRVGAAIEKRCGFRPAVRILAAADLRKIVASNPYPEAAATPKHLHVFFLERPPTKTGLERAGGLAASTERFASAGAALYLHAPDGIARSKLAGRMDSALGISTTARNWNTVLKLVELAESIE